MSTSNNMRIIWTEEETAAFIDLLLDEAFQGNIHYSKENKEAFERIIPKLEAMTGKRFSFGQLHRKFIELHYRYRLWEKATNCGFVRWDLNANVLVSEDETWEILVKCTLHREWARMYRHEGERYWWEFSVIFASEFPLDEKKVLPFRVVPDRRKRENEGHGNDSHDKRMRTF